jgi:putative Mg2+ transporter-C (MgtC) family protein
MDLELQLTLIGRAALAAALGFAIGLEREWRGKSAGERTFALFAFGTAAVTAGGVLILDTQGVSRVIQGVLTGVGFLGGGLIFRRSPENIYGLTTAAGSWAATGIGILAGLGAYVAAVAGAAVILLLFQLDLIPKVRRIRDAAQEAATESESGSESESPDDEG